MKKTRTIALALIVAVAMIGAGFAAWGTHITDTTFLGTGKWSVVLESDSGYSYWAADKVSNFKDKDGTHKEVGTNSYEWAQYDQIDANEKVTGSGTNYVYTMAPVPAGTDITDAAGNNKGVTACAFSFYNLHPGTQAMTRFEIRNDGTIPAKIQDVDVAIKYWNGTEFANADASAPQNVKDAIDAMMVDPYFGIHHGTGNDTTVINPPKVALSELKTSLNHYLANRLLNPSDKIFTVDKSSDELELGVDAESPVFRFILPADSLGDGEGQNLGMGATLKVIVDFHFVQYNEIASAAN